MADDVPSHPLTGGPSRNGITLVAVVHWEYLQGWDAAMEPYQWFLLGLMVAWTPGLLALGFMLWRRHIDQTRAENGSRHCGR